MSWRSLLRKPLLILYGTGLVLLVLAGWLWFAVLNTNPERVFWKTLEQGLSTTGVTIQASQNNGGVGIKQQLHYSFGGMSLSHSVTRLTQGKTTIVDEMIGTPKADYTRYVSISTDQTKNGKRLDFSKALGVWAKSNPGDKPQLFPQAVIGTSLPLGGVALPVANLDSKSRHQLLAQIHQDNVYKVDFGKAKKQTVGGRLQYIYDIKMNPVAYAKMMKQFAQSVGLHELDELEASTFNGQPDFQLRLTVDARSYHVVEAASVAPNGTQAASQVYTGYDIPVTMALPKQTVTMTELQKRLSDAQ